jgi:hypothetical protein
MFEGETNVTPNYSVTRLASSNYYTFTTPERFGLHRSCNPKRMNAMNLAEGGDSNPCYGVYSLKRFSKRVIALWLACKLLKTRDAARRTLDSLGTVGSLLG